MNTKISRKTRKTKHVERIDCRLVINLLGSTVVPVQDNPFLSSPSYSSSNSDGITYLIHGGQFPTSPPTDPEIPIFSLPYLSNPSISTSSDSSQKVSIRSRVAICVCSSSNWLQTVSICDGCMKDSSPWMLMMMSALVLILQAASSMRSVPLL